jgi:SagB-type dehydrogenase family enzyme
MHASMAGPSHTARLISLPQPSETGTVTVERALATRRSVRAYRDAALSQAQLAQLLWAAQGITDSDEKRAAPSAGALYPLDVYVVVGNVENLAAGVYRYVPAKHALATLAAGDRRITLATAANAQDWLARVPAVLVVAADAERTRWKYGDRTGRYVQMETGHVAQNVALQAVALGLATVVVGAFDDARVRELAGLAPGSEPVCMLPVGYSAE